MAKEDGKGNDQAVGPAGEPLAGRIRLGRRGRLPGGLERCFRSWQRCSVQVLADGLADFSYRSVGSVHVGDFAHDAVVPEDQDPAGQLDDFRQVGGDEDDGFACGAARSQISRWICSLAPMSTPTVGSSMMRMSQSAASHLAMQTFCWLPPLRSAGGLVQSGAFDGQRARPGHGRSRVRLSAIDTAGQPVAQAFPDGDGDVSAQPEHRAAALLPCGSRSHSRCDTGAGCLTRSESVALSPRTKIAPLSGTSSPIRSRARLGPARAH